MKMKTKCRVFFGRINATDGLEYIKEKEDVCFWCSQKKATRPFGTMKLRCHQISRCRNKPAITCT